MNFPKQSQHGWLALVSVGVISALTITGCDRSKKDDSTEETTTKVTTETEVVTKSVPAVDCDDPMVQDRLKLMLQTTLNQKAQSLATSYATQANIAVDSRVLGSNINDVLIDIQNPTVLEATNATGATTCQASVSMTLPSQDLYQANQVYASAGRTSIQDRMAEQNIRFNNNMLVDDSFSYVVGTQGGELKIRIAGQPAILDLVSDVVAGSLVQTTLNTRRAQIAEQKARVQQERRQQQANRRVREEPRIRQPQSVKPVAPTQATKPATAMPEPKPQSNSEANTSTSSSLAPSNSKPSSSAPVPAETNKKATVPTDKSINMVIEEDPNATY